MSVDGDKPVQIPYPWRSVFWCHIVNDPCVPTGSTLGGVIQCPLCNWKEPLTVTSDRHFFIPAAFLSMHTLRAALSNWQMAAFTGEEEGDLPVTVKTVQEYFAPVDASKPTA